MEINVPLLKQICEIAGAPGFEKRVRDLVIDLVTPLADEVKTDNLGNVIAIKKGKRNPDGKRVMVAATWMRSALLSPILMSRAF